MSLRNIEKSQILKLSNLVAYQDQQVVSKTLVQNKHVGITLFAFDADEQISTHASHGDALVQILDGQAQITIGEEHYTLTDGESIVMPAEIPHAIYAPARMKFMLTVVF